jgi:hypothetical protein
MEQPQPRRHLPGRTQAITSLVMGTIGLVAFQVPVLSMLIGVEAIVAGYLTLNIEKRDIDLDSGTRTLGHVGIVLGVLACAFGSVSTFLLILVLIKSR